MKRVSRVMVVLLALTCITGCAPLEYLVKARKLSGSQMWQRALAASGDLPLVSLSLSERGNETHLSLQRYANKSISQVTVSENELFPVNLGSRVWYGDKIPFKPSDVNIDALWKELKTKIKNNPKCPDKLQEGALLAPDRNLDFEVAPSGKPIVDIVCEAGKGYNTISTRIGKTQIKPLELNAKGFERAMGIVKDFYGKDKLLNLRIDFKEGRVATVSEPVKHIDGSNAKNFLNLSKDPKEPIEWGTLSPMNRALAPKTGRAFEASAVSAKTVERVFSDLRASNYSVDAINSIEIVSEKEGVLTVRVDTSESSLRLRGHYPIGG